MKTVLPPDFLAFTIGSTMVGGTHFVYSTPKGRDFRRKLRFKSESVLLDCNAANGNVIATLCGTESATRLFD